uniref:Laminin EGF-like domain-containing protein n=1 Tax=Romanomermis culicivorax TaxID=13658 RepID=A0A915KF28_ROMCU
MTLNKDCKHNTYGPKCELCKPPFVGDATRGTPHDCDDGSRRRCSHCQCYNHSPRGCDENCRCVRCEHNTEGVNCEVCKPGFYGDARRGTPYDCKPCPCPE